jgi:hypothetical protein
MFSVGRHAMRRYLLIVAAVACTAALAAPIASAQTAEPFNAAYTMHFLTLGGHPTGGLTCAADAFACGSGTAPGFGAFTTQFGFDENCPCVFRTLTFSDGSTLVLDEEFASFTGPGGSGSSHAPGTSEGHPGSYGWTWTFISGTGTFAGLTGSSGTENYLSAGLIASGTITGTLTTS